MTGVLIIRGKFVHTHTHTHTEKPCEDTGKMAVGEIGVMPS